MADPAMIFTNSADETFAFDTERLPLITRRPTHIRKGDQSGSRRRIDCQLAGYFTGETPEALRAKYDELVDFLSNNRVNFYFFDGNSAILDNQPVYISEISEPTQTHRYMIDFTISMYYHKAVASHAADPVTCSYQSEAGTYTFVVTPQWSFSEQPDRQDALGKTALPTGSDKGSVVNIQLSGEVCADTHTALEADRVNMFNIFRKDGTLNYGDFSAPVKVGRKQIPTVTPNEYFEYTIDLTYFVPGLLDFKCKRRIGRLHLDPIIRENSGCGGTPYVITRNTQGQVIDYSAQARGGTIESIRTAIATEIALLVYSGGYELPGGFEEWEEDPPAVTLQFSRYYPTPQIANLGDF